MDLVDFIFILNQQEKLVSISWQNSQLRPFYEATFSSCIGKPIETLGLSLSDSSATCLWKGEQFHYSRFSMSDCELIFFKQDADKDALYEATLNKIPYGIQVYDQNACAIFFNQTSRALACIPDDVSIAGQHLLDLYSEEKEISTVLTSLRTKAPIVDRIDSFHAANGTSITSSNTAYPIFKDGALIGSVAFEQDSELVKAQIEKLELVEKQLSQQEAPTHQMQFTGYSFSDIIGTEKVAEAVSLARRVAAQDCNVLLVGETGTGKEIFAQGIHKASKRRKSKFVAINCAAMPDTLIESLLFGTCKGAFTGSMDKLGFFEEADGGTLFLDEMNSMSMEMQSKLLRVLQEGVFRRIGGSKDLSTNVRIVASCNEDPFCLIAANTLRKDLFYRLATVTIELPPLRAHLQDIDLLLAHYMKRKSHQYAKSIKEIQPEVLAVLKKHIWPGNVRELFNVFDYMFNVVEDSIIRPEHLPRYLREKTTVAEFSPFSPAPRSGAASGPIESLQLVLDRAEEEAIRNALEHNDYNISKTADMLCIRRQSLQYRIKKLNIII